MSFFSTAAQKIADVFTGGPSAETHTYYRAPYEGGSPVGGEVSNWLPGIMQPDDERDATGSMLKARARDLVRNDAFANNAVRTRSNNVVGAKIRITLKPDYNVLGVDAKTARSWSRIVERHLNLWSDSFRFNADATRRQTLAQLLNTICTAAFTDGEAFGIVQFDRRFLDKGLRLGTCLQLISSDRIETPPNLVADRNVKNGIRYDSLGAPITCYVRKSHPAETSATIKEQGYIGIPFRERTGRPRVIHVFDQIMPETKRGVTRFANAIIGMKMLKRYNSTELQRASMQAMYAAVIKSNLPYDQAMNVIGTDTDAMKTKYGNNFLLGMSVEHLKATAEYHREAGITMNGVRIPHLLPNEDLDIKVPQIAGSNFAQFEAAFLRQFAAGLGVDFASLSKNYSQMPYAAARLALMDAWRDYLVSRENIMSSAARPLVAAAIEEMFLLGLIGLPDGVTDFYASWEALARCEIVIAGKPQIDPLKERNAQKVGYDLGVETLESIASQDGADWEERLEQKAYELDVMEELDLPLSQVDPNAVVEPNSIDDEEISN